MEEVLHSTFYLSKRSYQKQKYLLFQSVILICILYYHTYDDIMIITESLTCKQKLNIAAGQDAANLTTVLYVLLFIYSITIHH